MQQKANLPLSRYPVNIVMSSSHYNPGGKEFNKEQEDEFMEAKESKKVIRLVQ